MVHPEYPYFFSVIVLYRNRINGIHTHTEKKESYVKELAHYGGWQVQNL